MGGRRLSIADPEKIVDDWPETRPVGRERRKQEYREQRAALKAQEAPEPVPAPAPAEAPAPLACCPGPVCEFKFPLPSPEVYFPDWDFVLQPWGPPLDDPKVKAYCDIQTRALLKHWGVRKSA